MHKATRSRWVRWFPCELSSLVFEVNVTPYAVGERFDIELSFAKSQSVGEFLL